MKQKGVRLVALGAALARALQEVEQLLVRQRAGKAEKAQAHLVLAEPGKQAKAALEPAQRQRRTGALPSPARTRTYSKRSRESRTRKPWCNPIPR